MFPTEQHTDRRAGFHGRGVVFHHGTMYWHPTSEVFLFAHEVAHAVLLPEAQRPTWEGNALPTGGDPQGESNELLALQVELCRGIRGYGYQTALQEMTEEGYWSTFPDGSVWWEEEGAASAPSPLPWEVRTERLAS